jgi:hypothetical protein
MDLMDLRREVKARLELELELAAVVRTALHT